MKKVLLFISVIAVALTMATVVFADDIGTCGKNVTYHFEEATGTLTISGAGAMEDFFGEYYWTFSSSSAADGKPYTPWCGYSSKIETVTIENDVTSIGDFAFYDCTALSSVTIGDSVTSIGMGAFWKCTRLTSVTIPDSVTGIGEIAFRNCTSLASVTIGDGVTSIGEWAFSGCTSLTSVTIPDSVKSIGSTAFYDCTALSSVTIGDGVTSIGGRAFEDCKSLTSVTIPDSVTSIGSSAFQYCTSLTSVTIGGGVTSIGRDAFSGCTGLKDVYYNNTMDKWKKISGNSYVPSKDVEFHCIPSYYITYSANGGEDEPSLQMKAEGASIKISSQKPKRSGYTFSGWSDNKNGGVVYEAGDTYEDDKDITLYAVWEKIITYYTVKYNANGGTGAPSAQTKAEEESLKLSTVKPTRTGYNFKGWATNVIGDVVYDPGDKYKDDKDITLYAVWEKNVTYTVEYNANGGTGAPSAQEKTKGESLKLSAVKPTRTGYNFKGWATNASGKVVYEAGDAYEDDKDITLYAVWDKNVTYTVKYNANGGTGAPSAQTKYQDVDLTLSSVIPEKTGYSFKGWATSVSGSVAYRAGSIYTANADVVLYALWSKDPIKGTCGSLKWTLDDDGTLTITGSGAMPDFTNESSAPWLAHADSIKSVVIGDGITSIGSSAFYNCTALLSVTIPNGVTSIGDEAFCGCDSLTSVTIGDSVTSIGDDAFYDCQKLTIYGYKDSYINNYAEQNELQFIELDSDTKSNEIILVIGTCRAIVFGRSVENDVAPLIVSSRTMLPARFVAENLGATVGWDNATHTVTITNDSTTIKIIIGSDTAYVNGVAKTLDSPAFLQNDRTYTPVRFICENLGANVDWDGTTQRVIITKQ